MRKSKSTILAMMVGVACAGPAFATGDGGDNGMTPWYGDSWANLQARDASASTVPSLQAQESAADARMAWANARERMRLAGQRLRENTSNTFHRMTRTGTVATTSEPSTTYGSTTTAPSTYGSTTTAPSTYGSTTTTPSSSYGTTARGSPPVGATGSSDSSTAYSSPGAPGAVTTGATGSAGTSMSAPDQGPLPTTPNADSARTDNPYDGKAPPAMSTGQQ
jgi:hypothetical protein